MAIEIFGFIVKPEISISDIAAIGALIASPLIFWFGYSRTRRSEQIKIARGLMDRIDVKLQKLNEIQLSDTQVSEAKTVEVLGAIRDLSLEIEYFSYLLKIHEIRDENILRYCIPRLHAGFMVAETYLEALKTRRIDTSPSATPDLDYYSRVLKGIKISMKGWLDKYKFGLLDLGITQLNPEI